MFTICFYQDTRHKKPLSWIRERLGIGYLSDRNDGMTELRINGYEQTRRIIEMLLPYIRFKKIQAKMIYRVATVLVSKKLKELGEEDRYMIAQSIEAIRQHNYQSGQKKNTNKLYEILGLTPYRLDSKESDPLSGG
ncbi:MAG: hypothetical protein BWY43_00628 [candidate division WS2 bacterium ADurb.Bin280]|uniref:Homing endonuclease LAGLIDADG domain-containing protein n=1 Tax=candidate division WS2 bacterium ADurb.Bin280 TaxID=1852829 RepID=A0A1V5SD62_9BACT|nr:MAG: hypothetical protein BWY43_00628 [candidate division WS2 bacterium ADurb.Bin280]